MKRLREMFINKHIKIKSKQKFYASASSSANLFEQKEKAVANNTIENAF